MILTTLWELWELSNLHVDFVTPALPKLTLPPSWHVSNSLVSKEAFASDVEFVYETVVHKIMFASL